MRRGWIGIVIGAVFAGLSLAAVAADDAGMTAWLKLRRSGFTDWRAAHSNSEAEITDIKTRTSALVAAQNMRVTDADVDRAPIIWNVSSAPVELWDGPDYPKMIVIPAGEYTMGSPESEPGRMANEGPRRRIRIGVSFAVSQYPVTMGEFSRFVADTKHDMGEACFTMEKGEYRLRAYRDWRHVGFPQTADGPALCVNWFDVQAYVAWLSKKTGHSYRLLSEAEYEYVNRAGTTTAYWWGNDIGRNRTNCDGCASAWDNKQLAPVGSFGANPFGLYDTTGNALSWLSDCWSANYNGSPVDGSANTGGDCDLHDLRGGSLHSAPKALRTAARSRHWFSLRNITVGFRVARTL